MNEWLIAVAGGSLVVLGFIGCVVPVLPGPIVAYCALWVPFLFGGRVPTSTLLIGAAVTVVATVMDYILPSTFAAKFKCSRSGVVGCVLGTIVGLFFLPIGLVVGPFAGTVVGELSTGKNLAGAARGGVGALLGFFAGIVAKLAAVCALGWMFLGLI